MYELKCGIFKKVGIVKSINNKSGSHKNVDNIKKANTIKM